MYYRFVIPTLAALLCAAGITFGSESVDVVLRMQTEGKDRDAMITYVSNSRADFNLSADDIQRLEDANVPATVIVAMLDKSPGNNPPNPIATPEPRETTTTTTTTTTTEVVVPEENDVSMFYETLSPYGEWVEVDNTYVFRPRVAVEVTDWRPYANDGHWVWTDSGWYWESTYPFGWATFHYGRWSYHDRYHWVWTPDTVWGPAWVDWRYSDRYYGWAPLPPGAVYTAGVGFNFHNRNVDVGVGFGLREDYYSFVPATSFLSVNIGAVIEPRNRSSEFFRSTREVKTAYGYTDNRVVNNGIPVREVEQRSGRKVEQVKIADAQAQPGQAIPREQIQGNQLQVFRPKVEARAASTTPQAAIARREQRMAKLGRPIQPNTAPTRTNPGAATQQQTTPVTSRQLSDTDARKRLDEAKARLRDQRNTNQQTREQQRDTRQQTQQQTQQQRTAEQQAEQQKREQERNAELQKREQQRTTDQQAREQQRTQQQQAQQTELQKREQERAAEQLKREQQTKAEQQAREQQRDTRQQATEAERAAQQRVQQQAQEKREQERNAEKQIREQQRDTRQQTQQAERVEQQRETQQAKQAREAQREAQQQAREKARDAKPDPRDRDDRDRK